MEKPNFSTSHLDFLKSLFHNTAAPGRWALVPAGEDVGKSLHYVIAGEVEHPRGDDLMSDVGHSQL